MTGRMNLVPTRVGMILSELESEVKRRACPHTRGDDPKDALYNQYKDILSPHAWG